jgi:hypothetical protein
MYIEEHLTHSVARRQNFHFAKNVEKYWGDKRASDITPESCRAFTRTRPKVSGRRELEILRAALRHWHRSSLGPLSEMPNMWFPPDPEPRERWLTRSELARLLWAGRRVPYLCRFILIGYYTGSAVERSMTSNGPGWTSLRDICGAERPVKRIGRTSSARGSGSVNGFSPI